MSDPEPDCDFRARLLRVVGERDRNLVVERRGIQLDALGRRYDRFRYGVPLEAPEKARNLFALKPPAAVSRKP